MIVSQSNFYSSNIFKRRIHLASAIEYERQIAKFDTFRIVIPDYVAYLMYNNFNKFFQSPDCAKCSGIGVRYHRNSHARPYI